MLPASSRLHRRQDIEHVVRFGQRLHTPHVVIYWKQQDSSQESRIACVAGKRVAATAVVRHRAQRLLREVARDFLPKLQDGFDMVWVGQASLSEVENQSALEDSLTPFFEKLPLKTL